MTTCAPFHSSVNVDTGFRTTPATSAHKWLALWDSSLCSLRADATVHCSVARDCWTVCDTQSTSTKSTSAARGSHGGPSVLRTLSEPLGVPDLHGCDLQRACLANQLYAFVAKALAECFELGILFSLEHPFRSLFWQLLVIMQALHRIPHATSDFHHCMFGSLRRKHSKLVHSVPRFSRLHMHCSHDHGHLAPNRTVPLPLLLRPAARRFFAR